MRPDSGPRDEPEAHGVSQARFLELRVGRGMPGSTQPSGTPTSSAPERCPSRRSPVVTRRRSTVETLSVPSKTLSAAPDLDPWQEFSQEDLDGWMAAAGIEQAE